MTQRDAEWVTERVAVLMTPIGKAIVTDPATSYGLFLGPFFHEAGVSYVTRIDQRDEEEALEVALKQLEWSSRRAEHTFDQDLAEVHAAVIARS